MGRNCVLKGPGKAIKVKLQLDEFGKFCEKESQVSLTRDQRNGFVIAAEGENWL